MRTAYARFVVLALAVALAAVLAGCSTGSPSASSASGPSSAASSSAAASSAAASSDSSAPASASASFAAMPELANGEYTVDVSTDSSMFHINEADEGTGVLTVSDDGMTVYIRLASKKIVNMYAGTSDEAKADAGHVIQPITDTVTYSDGEQKEVYGFEIPVPALDEEFGVAILGEKGTWYDHKVSVSNPEVK